MHEDHAATTPNAPGLARRLARGDHDALDAIIDAHYDRCLAAARAFTKRDDSFCRDATQDAMLRLVRKPPQLRDDEHLARWLGAAVRSACLDQIRSETRRARRELGRDSAQPTTIDAETIVSIRESLASLDPLEHSVLSQRFGRDRSLGQIALDLNTTRDSVKSRLARTLAKLRPRFSPATHDADPAVQVNRKPKP